MAQPVHIPAFRHWLSLFLASLPLAAPIKQVRGYDRQCLCSASDQSQPQGSGQAANPLLSCFEAERESGNYCFSFMMNYPSNCIWQSKIDRDPCKSLMTKTVCLYLMRVQPSCLKSSCWGLFWFWQDAVAEAPGLACRQPGGNAARGQGCCTRLRAQAAAGGREGNGATVPMPWATAAWSRLCCSSEEALRGWKPGNSLCGNYRPDLQVMLPLSVQKSWNWLKMMPLLFNVRRKGSCSTSSYYN